MNTLTQPIDTVKPSPNGTPAAEPTAEDIRDYHDWVAAASARDFLDAGERLTLAELVARQADFYRGWGNPAGEMIAQAMDRLAMQVRLTGANTPDEIEARVEILDAEANEQREAIAYEEGRQHGRHETGRLAAGYLD